MAVGPFRRIVTGHDASGAAIVVSDGAPDRIRKLGASGPTFYEVWNTRETPARIDRLGIEPAEEGLILAPPKNGTRIRVLDLPPESEELLALSADAARAHFAAIGAADASTHDGGSHPLMHRTETIDYGIVLEGEIVLIVDKGETHLRAGDIVIQRGTNHAWSNRSGKICRIAFILIDGVFDTDVGLGLPRVEAREFLSRPFAILSDLIAAHAIERGDKRALVEGNDSLSYAQLDARMDRVALALQRASVAKGEAVAIVGAPGLAYATVFLGAVRAGCVPTPLSPTSTPEQLCRMIEDSGASLVVGDDGILETLPAMRARFISLAALEEWLPEGSPAPVNIDADDAFNIIYSSGTTGVPKGIVQSHGMRWAQIMSAGIAGYGDAVTIVATPLYSNTTLASLLPTLAYGGTAILLRKFDALDFLSIAERERATHAFLVPVLYQRLMALPEFDRFDLSSFRFKACTGAPFAAALKADIVARWPGQLVEIYGMTEGGGVSSLQANAFPEKLHTVGRPTPSSDMRIIDEAGRELPQGEIGEVVGRSAAMMSGYHGRPEATGASEWRDGEGNRFIRHGDLGRFDEDGFLVLLGRSKDMIISGGFNIYPPDIEAVLSQHPGVQECAVIGVASETWGETPYAFYVAKGEDVGSDEILTWVNTRVGKTQRLSGAEAVAELPRSGIGKILKRELRPTAKA